ncbi:MAG: flagellar basal body rod protein FlgC [Fimbriiglobus sp.]|jgi:flagellar basal-body rod protein FlgC|nr:flagellar basal body rod protein FlgC [Fimbriiglobus sp.]
MPFSNLFTASAISGTGLSAERYRMEVIANNIANANSTKSANGGPFRRQDVVFEEVLRGAGDGGPGLGGVRVVELVEDQSELPLVHMPGHPDADADGYVRMPNVNLPIEMVNLLTASRAYEANLRASQAFRTQNEQALILIRG